MAEFVRNLQDIANIREIRENRRAQRVFRPRENSFEKFSGFSKTVTNERGNLFRRRFIAEHFA
ncbi:hypothetical protein TcasGA2_TC002179 [Tribolium castaneum]|uniref:Uncharacterized protein n=1 Tax=Tribolium castaneum TaxID=7070 RepID=D6WY80_TRICA|nr:hypothetical protein TcasGA2_TC002179 [Tribolium castaneum]